MSKPYLIIDIETLGTGMQAPVFAFAALNHLGESVRLKFSVSEQLKNGAELSDDALTFWLNQAPACWLSEYRATTAYSVISELARLYKGGGAWTRGNDFDIPILGNFLRRMSHDTCSDRGWHPWEYPDLHNIRTAELLTGKNPFAKKAHDPLQDCVDCIWIIENFYAVIDQEQQAKAQEQSA